jgi:hypothetical protein
MSTSDRETDIVAPFERLDFLYVPSGDVAADRTYFTEVLGGRLAFAIQNGGTRVAAVELTSGPPSCSSPTIWKANGRSSCTA